MQSRPRAFAAAVVGVAVALLVAAPQTSGFVTGVPDGSEHVLNGGSSFFAGVCDISDPATDDGGSGTGSAPSPRTDCVDFGVFPDIEHLPAESLPRPWKTPPAWRLDPAVEAGAHPDGTASMAFDVSNGLLTSGPSALPEEYVRTVLVELPAGVVGNPQAVGECSQEAFAASPQQCSPEGQVGTLTLRLIVDIGFEAPTTHLYPVYNLAPRPGYAAELGIPDVGMPNLVAGGAAVRVLARARTDGDFGVTTGVMYIPTAWPLIAQAVSVWGVPWSSEHDAYRLAGSLSVNGVPTHSNMPEEGLDPADRALYDPSWGPIRPFFTTETDCNPNPVTGLVASSYQEPGDWKDPDAPPGDLEPDLTDPRWFLDDYPSPPVEGCEDLAFDPDIDFGLTDGAGGEQRTADGPAGLAVDLAVPQNNDPPVNIAHNPNAAPAHWRSGAGRATAHLKDTVVALPEGLAVNPSGATGLEGCSNGQIGITGKQGVRYLFNNGDPFNKDGGADGAECPDGSKIGTARVDTPLLATPLTGEVVLGTPESTDPRSGGMFRLFLVLRNEERNLVAKVFGSTTADGNVGEGGSGQLRATFLENPEVPFGNLELEFRGGGHSLLAAPRDCAASHSWTAAFTPWSAVGAPVSVPDAPDGGTLPVDQRCGQGFAPALATGMSTNAARANGTFSFKFTRQDGEQHLSGLTATLPEGLLASVKGFPLCTNAQAAAASCPEVSRIGIVDAKAGAGDPFVLEQKGEIYLTEGYKGGEYGLAVKVRPIAGPFRESMELSTILVRQAIHVDRQTAKVTAISDPFPRVWHGVPLRVREVNVIVDRDKFMLNPSDCARWQVDATIAADRGATASPSDPFQVANCPDLPFKPKLGLRLTNRKQMTTGKHPGIRAVVTQKGIPEAGIQRAEVQLPKTLALDVDNAQALCEFEDGTKPDLENHCPKGSIVGRARAVTPLLNDPLAGNVYFVKNVRRSATGSLIRTLPMLIVALRGEISVNLKGESDVKRGKLVSTFASVPDAPVSRFNMNINGGRNGIVAVTRTRRSLINLCKAGRQTADALMDGQNGRRHDRVIKLRLPCKVRKAAKVKMRKAAWRGGRLVVSGTVAKVARRSVRVAVRCGSARAGRLARPNRRGVWKTTLKLPGRCTRAGKARVTASYPGGPNLARGSASRLVRAG